MKIIKEKLEERGLNRKILVKVNGVADRAMIDIGNDVVTIYTQHGKDITLSKEDIVFIYNSI